MFIALDLTKMRRTPLGVPCCFPLLHHPMICAMTLISLAIFLICGYSFRVLQPSRSNEQLPHG